MSNKNSGVLAVVTMAMLSGMPIAQEAGSSALHNGVNREQHPWDDIQLSKAERRGKTAEEIQALRKSRWETAKGEKK